MTKPTMIIRACSGTRVLAELEAHIVNRVPVRGTIWFEIQADGTLAEKRPHEVWLRRSDKFLEDVSFKTKVACIEQARQRLTEWIATPEGAYALVHAEAEDREVDLVRALSALTEAERALAAAKATVKAAKAAHAQASKARTVLYNKQNPR